MSPPAPNVRAMDKPEGIREFEDALLLAIMLFTVVTWIVTLMRLLTG